MSLVISVIGILVLLGLAFALSEKKKSVNFKLVALALGTQVFFAALVLYIPTGQAVLNSVTSAVSSVIGYAEDGMVFMFGGLATNKMHEVFPGNGFVFAFKVLPIVVFFSALVAVLYHYGIMQMVVRILGGGLQKLLGTSPAESLSATSNIFVGQTEAPLVVRPYISRMTRSELFAVMVGGLASIAGSVMAGYTAMGVELKYLIAASFMSAPGGILMAKIIIPETEKTAHAGEVEDVAAHDKPANAIDAAATGAADGLKLAANIGGMLIAFISLIALLNGMLGGIAAWFGAEGLTIQEILGYLFSPLAWVIGVPSTEISAVGSLIGQKLILNEFVAYSEFINIRETLSPSSQVIATFALCGFANLSSIAILLGGLGTMAPNRRQEIARLGLKAVAAGTLANLMSATIAGMFFNLGSL
ncbi:NupC/NupG family nucleoside CNT transporter [Bacterioplanoides sp.]|uniref:NupC/NupG family nucleoside CNT transporter n=1 Tax=Bacterioplanoides sp. TaxID=2066072 RepID=UPI003B0052F3